jgi:hypothetical protein
MLARYKINFWINKAINGDKTMTNIKCFLVFTVLLLIPLTSIAEDKISFKGIKFGMNAKEIEMHGGGDPKSCYGAIYRGSSLNDEDKPPWTYGGIDNWVAFCVESSPEEYHVPGTSGMFQLFTLVPSYNSTSYSVDDLVEIFTTVFGEFEVKTKIFKNGLEQTFLKKTATATHKDALIEIKDKTEGSNHEDFITVEITSLDYLAKKAKYDRTIIEMQLLNSQKKFNDAKKDF